MSNQVCKCFLLESVSTTHGREQQIEKTAYRGEKKESENEARCFQITTFGS